MPRYLQGVYDYISEWPEYKFRGFALLFGFLSVTALLLVLITPFRDRLVSIINPGIAGKVNGAEIAKRDVNALAWVMSERVRAAELADPNSIQIMGFEPAPGEYGRALEYLIETELLRQEGAKQGVGYSSEDINRLAQQEYPSLAAADPEVRAAWSLFFEGAVLREKVAEKVVDWRAGELLTIYFFRNINNEIQYKKDKAHARELADELYKAVANNSKTVAEAAAVVKSDKKLGETNWQSPYPFKFSGYRSFDRLDSELKEQFSGVRGFWDSVFSRTSVGVLPPKLFQVHRDIALSSGEEEYVDGGYFLINITDGNFGGFDNYGAWLSAAKDNASITRY